MAALTGKKIVIIGGSSGIGLTCRHRNLGKHFSR
jgi:short-subunit dehydrogenase involved in D-alanine esterification of teichoic acids